MKAVLVAAGPAPKWDLKAALVQHASSEQQTLVDEPRVALITAVVGQLPRHIGLLAQSCAHSHRVADCLIYYTEEGAHDDSLVSSLMCYRQHRHKLLSPLVAPACDRKRPVQVDQ